MDKIPTEYQEIVQSYVKSAPFDLVEFAERLGLEVYQTDTFEDSKSGSIVLDMDGKYKVYVNKRHSAYRKRFTLAHEVAHYLLHKDKLIAGREVIADVFQPTSLERSDMKDLTAEEKQCEYDANELAAELLMPTEQFKAVFCRSTSIEDVAETFKVSVAAASVRAAKLMGKMIM